MAEKLLIGQVHYYTDPRFVEVVPVPLSKSPFRFMLRSRFILPIRGCGNG